MDIKLQLQNTDIYLIDLILKGKLDNVKTVLDVGCGSGRNLVYFLQNSFDVFAVDPDEKRLIKAQKLAKKLGYDISPKTNKE